MPSPEKQKFIVYVYGDRRRKVIILNGQPYYESLELNGLMLPIICCKGIFQPIVDPALPESQQRLITPAHLDAAPINTILLYRFNRRLFAHCFIKANKHTITLAAIDVDINKIDSVLMQQFHNEYVKGQLVMKKHLLGAIRLSPALFQGNPTSLNELMDAGKFDPEERRLALEPVLLKDEPELVTTSPDRLNLWLLENGADDIKSIFCQNKGLADILARYAAHPLFNMMRQFVPRYTRNFFNPLADDRIQAAGFAWIDLYDETRKYARKRIELGSPIQRVKRRAVALAEEVQQFVDTEIGEKLDDRKTQTLVNRLQELTTLNSSGESPEQTHPDERRVQIRRR